MPSDRRELLARLQPWGQEHLLAHWDELAPTEREQLVDQLEQVDFEHLAELLSEDPTAENWGALATRSGPPPAIRLHGPQRHSAPEARRRGQAALSGGYVGVLIVAGGQGTRLGFDEPKGMFPIGPVSQATLFQIFFEAIGAVGQRYGARVPAYVMTSPATDAATRTYLEAEQWFGLEPADVTLFCQGTMPAVDAQSGRVLLADQGLLALSPDGHGGIVAALARSGALADIRQRGLKHLFYMQVDNPLVRVADPEFLGYHLLADAELSTWVVEKHDPQEKVGNLVEVDGRVRIIEYSDLPDDVAARRTPEGGLALWAGNTAIHWIETELLARTAASPRALPFHRALKKVSTIDAQGRAVEPDEPNAIKFERFVFDLLPLARRALAVEVDARQVFAPVKNAAGDTHDTPETARAQMIALHTAWLRAAGVEVATGVPVEISPRLALDVEQLIERVQAGAHIRAGEQVTAPRYFC